MATERITSIAVAVIEHQGRVLVGRRAEGVPLAGYCEFPGGKVHPGESPDEAAVRECREETGLAVTVRGTYGSVDYVYDDGPVRLHFLAASPVVPQQPPKRPFRWVPVAALAPEQFPPANRSMIRRLKQPPDADPENDRRGS